MARRPVVLITAPRMLRDWEHIVDLRERYPFKYRLLDVEEAATEPQLLEAVPGIDAAICGDDPWTAAVMNAGRPTLRAICKWGTGIDSIDAAAAARRSITIRNVPDAFSVPVADTVLAHLLAFARRRDELDRAMKRGEWHKIPGTTLAESTLGIVGVGAIGRTVARRAAAFGMTLLGCDPVTPPLQFLDDTRMQLTDLDTLLRESDFVSLHCDLNPTSRQILNAHAISLMKPTAVVVNTARGGLIEETALVRALQQGRLAGAGLDVFEVEPLPAQSPLRAMSNVSLSPHCANSSDLACLKVHERVLENVSAALETHR